MRHQKKETTNSPIYEFKVLQKGQRASQNPFLMVHYFLPYKRFKPCFFILKALKDIFAALHELVNSWFRFFLMSRTGYLCGIRGQHFLLFSNAKLLT